MLVEGEAGIGKTRLIAQLRAATRNERVEFLVGRSAEYLQAPYEPFIDALHAEAENRSIEAALREPSARSGSADEERARRFAVVDRFLRKRASERGAVVLVIEDLHWSDATSLDLFRHLARRLDDVPVILIATYRESEVDAHAGYRTAVERLQREGAMRVALAPWSDAELAEAIRDSLSAPGVLSDERIRSISELSEGRPFIAEELLREALDNAGKPDAGAVPLLSLSLRGHVPERLRALDAKQQQILMYAAAIGRDFDVDLLAYLTQSSDDEVLDAIRKARRAQLVADDAHSGRFTFRHALTRAILYSELLVTEARALHATIARAFESGRFAAPIEAIAYHWWAARDADRAVATNEQAGDRALAIGAPADAARFYERALEFAVLRSQRRYALLDAVVRAENAAGHAQACLSWCQRAEIELRQAGEADEAIRYALRAGHQHYALGNLDAAKTQIEAVRVALRAFPISPRHLSAELSFAMVLVAEGASARALEVIDAIDASEETWSPRERWRAATIRGNALGELSRFDESLASYRTSLEMAVEAGAPDLEVLARNNLAVTAMVIGDTRAAKRAYEEALDAAHKFGLTGERSMIVANLALCVLQLGDFTEAKRLADRTLSHEHDRAAPAILGAAVDLRLQTLAEYGPVRGERWISGLIERALRTASPELVAAATGAAAEEFLLRGDDAAARDAVARGVERLASLSPYWIFDAIAQLGDDEALARGRAALVAGDGGGRNVAAAAHLALFDARVARRRDEDAGEVKRLAMTAHAAFSALGWPVEAAISLELAGDRQGALDAFRAIAAIRQVRRLEDALGKRRTTVPEALGLSRREEETARLLVRGYSNRTVADALGIGERTVETHVASIYRKLGIKSRAELVTRLAESL